MAMFTMPIVAQLAEIRTIAEARFNLRCRLEDVLFNYCIPAYFA